MVKLTPRKMQGSRIILHSLYDSTNHTLAMADNTEIGVDNLETILDGMVAEMGLEKFFTNAIKEIDI
ncbi:2-aminoethylphosphonate--pyruvate transaminase [Bienertia sinuspersici]